MGRATTLYDLPDWTLRAMVHHVNGLSTRQVAEVFEVSGTYAAHVLDLVGCRRGRSEAGMLRNPSTSKHWRSARAHARKVWTRAHGAIPRGFHIHHLDGDYTNNVLANLACLSPREHAAIHRPANPTPRHLRPERQAYMKAYFAARREREKEAKTSAPETGRLSITETVPCTATVAVSAKTN